MKDKIYIKHSNLSLTLSFILFTTFHLPLQAQLAEGDCNFVGNIISNSVPSNFNDYWNQVTPENAGKWGSVENTRDVMSWTSLDLAYNHAIDNGYPFKQHTFIWDQQKPSWIDGLSESEQLEEIEEWMKAYGERYPQTSFIEVVNEPLHAMPTFRNAMGGAGETGYDWIIWAFEKAREHNPNAKLLINDYHILNNSTNTNNYLKIIEVLQEKGLIDGIGVQGHFLESTSNELIKANLDKLAATELPVYVTEYDINLSSDLQQEIVMKAQFPLLYQHPSVEGITFWGYQQGHIWREDAYLIKSNGLERPAMVWLREYLEARCSGILSTNKEIPYESGLINSINPNPLENGTLNISFSDNVEHITISDLSGKTVYEKVFNSGLTFMSLSLDLKPGIYIVHCKSGEKISSGKVLIK